VKVAIYTAVYGAYEKVRPAPDVDAPCYFYTDDWVLAELARVNGWTPRRVNHGVATFNGDPSITGPMLAHKWWKTHPELACPDAEISIWMDGSMEVAVEGYIERRLGQLGGEDLALMKHPERNCIFPEAEYSAALTWRYDATAITKQADHYRNFHPADWHLFATGCIVRRHVPVILELGHQWWHENITWSHQDQLSLPVLVRLGEERGLRWNKNIDWLDGVTLHPHGG